MNRPTRHTTAPQNSGPSLRARWGHCTSQASATGRARRAESDRVSALAIEFDPDRAAAEEELRGGQRQEARRGPGRDHHLGPFEHEDAQELRERDREAEPVAAGDVANRVVARAEPRGRGRISAGVDDLDPCEGRPQAPKLDPVPAPEETASTLRRRGGGAASKGVTFATKLPSDPRPASRARTETTRLFCPRTPPPASETVTNPAKRAEPQQVFRPKELTTCAVAE